MTHKGTSCLHKSAADYTPIGIFIGPQTNKTSLWYQANQQLTTLYWSDAFVASYREEEVFFNSKPTRFWVYRLVPAARPWTEITKALLPADTKLNV